MNTEKPCEKPEPVSSSTAVSDSFVQSLRMLHGNKELLFQIIDKFPIPIEIFAPDGTSIFFNKAGSEWNNIKDLSLIVGKYNLLNDPVCNEEMGLRDLIQRAFKGETVSCPFSPPIQDLVDRGIIKEKPWESASTDLYMFPIFNGEEITFLVCVFIVKSLYRGRPDVARAMEFIDFHWLKAFDPKAVAKSVSMSERQLYNLFKKHIGITPGDYYKKCKIEHIKEKLANKNLNIKEAFTACGEDSRGSISKIFKRITGLSPREYRKSIR